jgi:hypothetical protein
MIPLVTSEATPWHLLQREMLMCSNTFHVPYENSESQFDLHNLLHSESHIISFLFRVGECLFELSLFTHKNCVKTIQTPVFSVQLDEKVILCPHFLKTHPLSVFHFYKFALCRGYIPSPCVFKYSSMVDISNADTILTWNHSENGRLKKTDE